MMRKRKHFVIAFLLLVVSLTLTACDADTPPSPSENEDQYEYNEKIHWNSKGEAPHTFVDGSCSVCGYPEPTDKKEDDTSLQFSVYDTYAVLVGIGNNTDKDLVVPDTYMGKPVTTIGYSAFAFKLVQAQFESIILPDSITTIEDKAFYSCETLESIYIGKGLSQIGELSFWGLSSLTTVAVDEENPYYKAVDNVLLTKDGKHLVKYAGEKTDSTYSVPDGVEHIDPYAFHSCKSLVNIVLPDGLKTIGDGAFSWSDHLETINIPEGVTTIGDGVFGYSVLTEVIFPDSVTSIGCDIFHFVEPLTKLHIGSGLAVFPAGLLCSIGQQVTLTISESNPYFCIIDDIVYNKSDMSVVWANTYPYDYVIASDLLS